ncbi:N-acetylmuramoyl-L-alanine amidase [Proteinivorax hydrogeniformans]|uniref:N-acetylmuramoyl-L-alanine amidase n=1 Tax=Proteinivorax hydrogeniformans TaxID=1826727 RepID=A0AAU8HTA3_9FIRM
MRGIKNVNISKDNTKSTVDIKIQGGFKYDIDSDSQDIKVNIEPKEDFKPSPQPGLKPLEGKTIVLDPGHGGSNTGAVGNGLLEKEVVLEISLIAEKKLKDQGANVLLTRRQDRRVSLSERVRVANDNNADIFVSVHVNGFTDPTARGTETYWYTRGSSSSRRLAQIMQRRMLSALNRRDRGVKQANFYVLRETDMPAVLLEPLFITNPEEAELIQRKETKEKIAEVILNGIIEFYS